MKIGRRFSTEKAVRWAVLCFGTLFALIATTATAQSAITLVQHAGLDAGITTSSSLVFPSANTAGNWIGVLVRAGALNENIFVSDSLGNSYKKALQFNQTADGFTAAIFYAENISGGANTVTVSDNINGTLRFAIAEYSGVATTNSLDVTATAQGNSTTPATASVNTTANGDLLLGTIMTGNPQNFTAGSGYKIEESAPALPNAKLILEDQIQASAGATLVNATISSADDWAAAVAAFKAANGAGGSTPTISNLNPNSGGVGTSVIITGANFLATQAQGNSTVKFNGMQTTPTAWSDTSITAPVPTGTTTGNVVVNINGVNSNGVLFTVLAPPSVAINQAAGQADPASTSPINFTAVFSAPVTGFSNSGVNLSGTAGATTAVVTGSGTTYNVAVSGMTQSGTVIAAIPAGVASANGLQNTASTSTDNTVTYNTIITPPSVALVQHAGLDAGTTTLSSLAFPSANTAGNWIGVVVRAGALNENISVSDSRGNSYKKALQFNQTADGFTAAIFYAENISGGANTVTVSDNINGTLRFAIAEYSGVATTNSLDVTATAQGNSTTPATASVNTTANGDLLLGTIMTGNPDNFTAGSGYRIEDSAPALPNAKLILEDQIQAGAGATLVSVTISTADDWAAAVAAFKAANGAGGTTPTISNLNPNSGGVGASVVITGTNFLATQAQGNSTVKFNGVQTTPTAWSDASITAPVPTGATTGNVIVTVNGVNSNGVLFTNSNPVVTVTVSPKRAGITTGQTQAFAATVTGSADTGVTWEVDTFPGGNAAVGTISPAGVYTPPSVGGVHSVVARSHANTTVTSPASSIAVTDLTGVFTYHNNPSRDGVNSKEYALTTSTVTGATFGKLFSCNMDGAVYAQPLWVANLLINGANHNVILAVSMRDTVYLFDADAAPCVTYWSKSMLPPGEAFVTNVDVGTSDIYPDIGILGTPVIDPSSNAVYLVAKTKTTSGTVVFHQRLHALNLADGSERTNSPVDLTSSITYPGSADAGDPTCPNAGGAVPFCPLRLNQRPALALAKGAVYVSWASHGDITPYHGWVIGFDASTLAQTGKFNVSPNGRMGGIWMSGGAPAVDSSNNLYLITGNGDWDGATEFGDSILELSTASGLALADWFTPSNQGSLDSADLDFGAGGAAVLADVPSASHPHLLIGGGKGSSFNGELYVLNRDSLGHMVANDTQAIQKIVIGGAIFSTEVFWNNTIYVAGTNSRLKAYTFDSTLGMFNTSSVPQTTTVFGFPGATPSVSSNGNSNGILWAIATISYGTNNSGPGSASPAVLHAYDATNIATELWNSSMSSGDAAGNAVKFTVPTIANGKVYVPTRGDDTTTNSPTARGRIDVYGLKPN